MLWVEIFCNYISRCSNSEESFVNERSLIKKGSFDSRIFMSILRFAYDQHLSFNSSVLLGNCLCNQSLQLVPSCVPTLILNALVSNCESKRSYIYFLTKSNGIQCVREEHANEGCRPFAFRKFRANLFLSVSESLLKYGLITEIAVNFPERRICQVITL